MRVLIIGAGIGGLALAACLERRGVSDVVLVEQAVKQRGTGAGIQITSNAVHVLEWLSLKDELEKIGHISRGNIYRDIDDGHLVLHAEGGDQVSEMYGNSNYQLNREDLANMLRRRLSKKIQLYSETCVGVRMDGKKAVATLSNGEEIRGDVLIGADGVGSVTRNYISDDGAAQFAGVACWRSLIPGAEAAQIPLDRHSHAWFGKGRSVVAYWVGHGAYLNFVGSVEADEELRSSWRAKGTAQDLRNSFQGVTPIVRDLIEMVRSPFITGIYKHRPLDRYYKDSIAVMGDAAHPMMPYMAAGAGQAIEDSFALAWCLDSADGNIAVALSEYDERRRCRANRVQRASEEMANIYHHGNSVSTIGDTAFRNLVRGTGAGHFRDWLWSYNIVRDMRDRSVD